MPARPLAEVAAAASRVFTAKGFRPAGISDVSSVLGLSHGALYTYVESKQALLYLALLNAVRPEALRDLTLPVTSPPPEKIIELAEAWAADQARFMTVIKTALDAPLARPVEQELAEIVDEIYGFIDRNRTMLGLVARCAADLPELANWYFVQRRRGYVGRLAEYLDRRIGEGHLRPVPDLPVAARFIVETVAWFAMHRHGDPDSAMITDDAARRTVNHLLVSAFVS